MKRMPLFCLAVLSASTITAQRCSQFSITPLLSQLQMPVNSATSYSLSTTVPNSDGQATIKKYALYLEEIDSTIAQEQKGGTTLPKPGGPPPTIPGGPVDISPANPVTPLPQQAPTNGPAVALAKQTSSIPTDNAATLQLVTQTYDIGANQLAALDIELSGKLNALSMPMNNEINAVSLTAMGTCPGQPPAGMPTCACANGLDDKYWTAKIAIEDKYDAQRIALLQSYLTRIKSLTAQVDANIAQLQYGDAVQTPSYKAMLLNAQSAAFNNAFTTEFAAIKEINESGANLYVHKYNADHLVDYPGCQK
jgi:hypothetical protein